MIVADAGLVATDQWHLPHQLKTKMPNLQAISMLITR
jgi:hypothetical protein